MEKQLNDIKKQIRSKRYLTIGTYSDDVNGLASEINAITTAMTDYQLIDIKYSHIFETNEDYDYEQFTALVILERY